MSSIQKEIHQNAVDHGFWNGTEDPERVSIASKIALIHSELSEALEEYRHGRMLTYYADDKKPEGFGVELADAMIRIYDLSERLGLDIDSLVEMKHRYNTTRPFMHGGRKI